MFWNALEPSTSHLPRAARVGWVLRIHLVVRECDRTFWGSPAWYRKIQPAAQSPAHQRSEFLAINRGVLARHIQGSLVPAEMVVCVFCAVLRSVKSTVATVVCRQRRQITGFQQYIPQVRFIVDRRHDLMRFSFLHHVISMN